MKKSKQTKFSSWATLKEIVKFLKYDNKRLFLGIVLAFFNALCYVVGSFLIGYIFQVYFATIITSQNLNDFDYNGFFMWLIIMGLTFIAYGFFKYFESYIFIKVSFGAATKMRQQATKKLIKMPISYYDKQKAGDLISTLINDVNNVSNTLFNTLNQFFSSVFNIVLSIIAMMLVASFITLITVPLAMFLFLISLLVIKKSQPYFIKLQNLFGELNGFVEENLANQKIMNIYDRHETVFEKFKEITKSIRNTSYKADVIARSSEPWFGITSGLVNLTVSILATLLFIWKVPVWGVYGFGVDQNGHATSGLIVTFISLNWNFMGPFQNILNINFTFQVGIASSNRVLKLLKLDTKKPHKEDIFIDEIKGLIEFKDVCFKYNTKSPKFQLFNATFNAKPGQKIAIVGPTGAGKTTIINLLTKFYDYNSGSIKIDGNELKNINTENLRKHMSVVLQDTFMFNDTIENNIRLADKNVTLEQIKIAATLSNAIHFIETLPDGFKTMVENNGQNLSQGQRQLIAITRAILTNKSILILDEATSNIDSTTEEIIQESMLKLMKNKTSFVIAHRLSTIKSADLILVINNGEIIEMGNHRNLLDINGFYANLYNSQFR
ncbi:ABC transporter ATP-binding protein [Mycoplasmopsis alligatoris]|uniref:ABC transporter, ATP-binding protein n=1 Tax=Mycoplasmopsis alligatoris A21JP2 TaxID=747682 RepID=D4XW35_9BACT|nr:ABC transporter ATP-binding protein [Mycoplasmopsis alligatoris]EFF41448.1 ABC transporter, ATP-binding protein [Mycoplasmopsis alligatoris A21JP2]